MFDAHLHLRDERIATDLQRFLTEAQAGGLTGCIDCACFPEQWDRKIAAPFEVLPAYGLHPWQANDVPEAWLERLEAHLQSDAGALVGEIGLDGLRKVPDDGLAQRKVLVAQLELAVRLQRPIVCHGARAWGALFDLLEPWLSRLPAVLLHGVSFAPELLHHPFFKHKNVWMSIGCGLLNPRAKTLPALAMALPIDRLVVETDAPDMLPVDGKAFLPSLNHPNNLHLVLQRLAQLREIPLDELTQKTEANAHTFASGQI